MEYLLDVFALAREDASELGNELETLAAVYSLRSEVNFREITTQ
jgi:hypothetical protein